MQRLHIGRARSHFRAFWRQVRQGASGQIRTWPASGYVANSTYLFVPSCILTVAISWPHYFLEEQKKIEAERCDYRVQILAGSWKGRKENRVEA
jgi:hypothetical protein